MLEYHRAKQLLVDEMLIRSARKFPNKIAIIDNEVRMTYQLLQSRVSNLAGWFQSQGIKKGEKVALLLYNSIEYTECLFALAKIGAVAVPVNFRLQKLEFEYILDNSDAKMLVAHHDFTSVIEQIRPNLPLLEEVIIVDDRVEKAHSHYDYYAIFDNAFIPRLEELKDDDDFIIVYTSGTTGKPKGAVLTHKNVFMNAVNMDLECGLTKDEVQIITTPLFHIGGISALTMLMLVGGTSILHKKFDPEHILQTFDKEKVTYAFMVPSMWNILLEVPSFKEYNVKSLRIICTAAASTPLELKKKLMKSFPNVGVFDTFGHTELSASTATLKASDSLLKTGSVGLPYSNVEVRVVDENMVDVQPGEVGEIIYRGPTTMKEYYNNPEATKETLRGGWLHSGDLVMVDHDGYLTVVDRKKDMIISGGENIYPKEIEEVLYTHPDILEAAVVGVPDEKWGETVKAFVVTRNGKTLTEQEVVEYCTERIARYKKPHYVEFINELPRNGSGKILKTALRDNNLKV
ncbi:long-chain fatty acid--CoA ligase [Neobacillus sp. FSL H8-0543]|uniref:acyl-CoA synthetase n=1 Tax=Neobacillus sp. FSL H8-0543 TaxID=2954672 RepID=UPI00315873BF